MKKLFFFSLFFITANALAVTPWWEHTTVCRLNPARCYPNMGTGYFFDTSDVASWDITSNCWGKKYVCADALIRESDDPVALGRMEIAGGDRVKSDFDINVLNGDCFGVRKTSTDGTMASVDGRMVRVWCDNILELLDKPDVETIETGQITHNNTQPTCSELAQQNYVAVANGKCYGKYYDPARYYIQCDGENPTLIVLNGAADYDPNNTNTSYPSTQADADDIFNQMYDNVHDGGHS